jgi:hypothetical protein
MDKWRSGTFSTKAIRERVMELLSLVEKLVHDHREAGRLPLAADLEELVFVVKEYQRLLENTVASYQSTGGAAERQPS